MCTSIKLIYNKIKKLNYDGLHKKDNLQLQSDIKLHIRELNYE